MPTPHGGGNNPKLSKAKQAFLWAEGDQESGNNYSAVNASSGALGRWQVMPANVGPWTLETVGRTLTPDEFLASHAAQDDVAVGVLGGYFDSYGPRGAAAMWYSGQPDWHATYGNPPVYQYVDDVIALMAKAPGGAGLNLAAYENVQLPPPDSMTSWAPKVRVSAGSLSAAADHLVKTADAIRRL